jgi:hypothetical protein
MAAFWWSPVKMDCTTRSRALRGTRGWRLTRPSLPGKAVVIGWSSAATVELQRSLSAALVLLQIRERVREMRLVKERRQEQNRGSVAMRNLGFHGIPRSSPERSGRAPI